jgi:hypothetical protein
MPDCVVADAVVIEPVSASKFPAIGEKQGIYSIFALWLTQHSRNSWYRNGFCRNNLEMGTGNLL